MVSLTIDFNGSVEQYNELVEIMAKEKAVSGKRLSQILKSIKPIYITGLSIDFMGGEQVVDKKANGSLEATNYKY